MGKFGARHGLVVAVTTTLLLAASACGSGETKDSEENFSIGWVFPLSGTSAAVGGELKHATEIAVDDVNAETISGHELSVHYEDNKVDPKEQVTAVQRLISKYDVPVIVTGGSSLMLATIPIAKQANVVVNNTLSQVSLIPEQGGDRAFTYVPMASQEMESLAEQFDTCKIGKNAALIRVDSDFGKEVGDAFVDAWKSRGGTIITDQSYQAGSKDYRDVLTKVAAHDPDTVVVVANGGELGYLAKQNQDLGFNLPLAGGTYVVQQANYAIAGDAMNGVRAVGVVFSPQTEQAKTFDKKFREATGHSPDGFAAVTYDTIRIIAKAFTEVGTDPDDIATYLQGLHDYQGVLGTYTMGGPHKNVATVPFSKVEIQAGGTSYKPWTCP